VHSYSMTLILLSSGTTVQQRNGIFKIIFEDKRAFILR